MVKTAESHGAVDELEMLAGVTVIQTRVPVGGRGIMYMTLYLISESDAGSAVQIGMYKQQQRGASHFYDRQKTREGEEWLSHIRQRLLEINLAYR